MKRYQQLITITTMLGIGFVILQWFGFSELWSGGTTFEGSGAGQFLYVIAGLHAIHVLAGVIALIVMSFRAYSFRVRSYDSVPVEIMSTYWHFVDLLWIYLFIFFLWIQ
jgi:cytochrome c oxidase subunit 3